MPLKGFGGCCNCGKFTGPEPPCCLGKSLPATLYWDIVRQPALACVDPQPSPTTSPEPLFYQASWTFLELPGAPTGYAWVACAEFPDQYRYPENCSTTNQSCGTTINWLVFTVDPAILAAAESYFGLNGICAYSNIHAAVCDRNFSNILRLASCGELPFVDDDGIGPGWQLGASWAYPSAVTCDPFSVTFGTGGGAYDVYE